MIEIIDLHKNFGRKKVLQGINLKIESGETIVIIGSSGCGKSVLIKHIVGLLKPDSGSIIVEGQSVNELGPKELDQLRKKFGFLFQGAALFDSMTVEENIALPLVESDTKYTSSEISELVNEKLELVNMPATNEFKPAELSGGMRKRVGLARALINNPDYILYDEPTTGLDPVMADSIDRLIKDLTEKLNVTSIVVTHDMYSVKNVSNKVAMIYEGKIHFYGTDQELVTSNDPVIQKFIKRTEK